MFSSLRKLIIFFSKENTKTNNNGVWFLQNLDPVEVIRGTHHPLPCILPLVTSCCHRTRELESATLADAADVASEWFGVVWLRKQRCGRRHVVGYPPDALVFDISRDEPSIQANVISSTTFTSEVSGDTQPLNAAHLSSRIRRW